MGCEGSQHPDSYKFLSGYLWSITAVTSFWRRIAVSTSLLWTDIVSSPSYNTEIDRNLFFVRLHLKRSGAAPIDVRFGLPKWAEVSDANVALVWHPISEQLHRCRSIEIYGLSAKSMKTLLPLHGPLTGLRKLSIVNTFPSSSSPPFHPRRPRSRPSYSRNLLDKCRFPRLSFNTYRIPHQRHIARSS